MGKMFKKLEWGDENSVGILLNFHWASLGMFIPSWLSQCCQGAACAGYLQPAQSLRTDLGLMWQQIQISHLLPFLAPSLRIGSSVWSLKHRLLGILWLPGWRRSSTFTVHAVAVISHRETFWSCSARLCLAVNSFNKSMSDGGCWGESPG